MALFSKLLVKRASTSKFELCEMLLFFVFFLFICYLITIIISVPTIQNKLTFWIWIFQYLDSKDMAIPIHWWILRKGEASQDKNLLYIYPKTWTRQYSLYPCKKNGYPEFLIDFRITKKLLCFQQNTKKMPKKMSCLFIITLGWWKFLEIW